VIDETDDTDDDINKPAEHRRFLSRAQSALRPVFKYPFGQNIQQREDTGSSGSIEVGDSQGVPPSAFLTSNPSDIIQMTLS